MNLNQARTPVANIPRIEKETISNLQFPSSEVLSDKQTIKDRMYALHRATSLGNIHQQKVTLVFEDNQEIKSVRTTIWAITDRKAVLKAGRTIPVQRIHAVHIGD
jgi:uncharacterized iron-regulated protein